MAYNGLNWQKLELPFAAGLDQKTDDRARPQPFLDICSDAQFDEDGGLQTRLPYAAMSNTIFGGGTLSSCRRLAVVNGELCVLTDTTLYSWNAQQQAWVSRGAHLAVSVNETPRFVTTGDQVDGDRAELAGTVIYAWTEGTQVYAAAIDKTTGSVLVAPTAVSAAIGRPRLVALATKILFFVEASSTLLTVRAIDPAAPGTAIAGAGTTVLATNFNLYYDVQRAGTQDLVVGACRRQTTTSYTVFTVTPALSVATATPGRTCDGPIAVATIADGTQTQVIRGNSTNVQGDLITTSTLADVFTGQAIGTASGTPINQIAAAFSSTTCTAFWSAQESHSAADPLFQTKKNTVTTANVVGTQATLLLEVGLASCAFTRSGSAYIWVAFAGDSTSFGSGSPLGIRAQLQNTYFLVRDDGLIVSKAIWQVAGGFSPSIGHLPSIQAIGGNDWAWLGTFRRRIELGDNVDHTGLAARSPREIAFSFDANAARRTASLGRTLYVSSGVVQQYDGISLSEVGFFVYPWAFATGDLGAVGNLSAGTYSWKGTLAWTNAAGERERSTTATGEQLTVAVNHAVSLTVDYLWITNKLSRPPNLEVWRTLANAGDDAPYFLVTSQDPSIIGVANCYIPNVPTFGFNTFADILSDANLATKEANPENGPTLESLAPPGASIIIATDTRLLITGIPGDPDRVWYSRLRGDGEIASFHDALTIDVPRPGGDITSIAFLDEVLYVFRQTAIYALPGVGLDNNGEGQDFGPARIVSLDVGAVNHESVALTPQGLIFKSSKGWQMLHGNGGVEYIGDKVSDFDAETPLAVTVVETQRQVRILTASRMIVWDYRANQWGGWTIGDGVHACMYQGAHVYLTATGPKMQQAAYANLTYGLDVEETWVKPAQLTGAVAVGRVQPLGEYRSAFLLRLRMKYNYDETVVDDVVWSPSPTTVGGPLEMAHGPKRRTCQAFKVRLTAVAAGVQAILATSSGLSRAVTTSGSNWAATWAAKTGSNFVIGELGNSVTLSIGFESGSPNLIDVRDNFSYDPATGLWTAALGNVGVRVVCSAASLTVAALETAIAAGTALIQLSAADGTPGKTINAAGMAGMLTTGQLSGGTFTAPIGEALKLTGLGLLVGVQPGLYRRLPAAQKA